MNIFAQKVDSAEALRCRLKWIPKTWRI